MKKDDAPDHRLYAPAVWLLVAIHAIGCLCLYMNKPAHGHDWYPVECCGGRDCYVVTHVEPTSSGRVLLTPAGVVYVPNEQKTQLQTHDGNVHVCIEPGARDWLLCGTRCNQGYNAGRPPMPYVDPRVLCVFDPANS